MKKTSEPEPRCAGCNATPVRPRDAVEVELFPGTTVLLCHGRERVARRIGVELWHGAASVSAACLRRARERLARCPGCGDEGCPPATLCPECRAAIKRSGELEGARGDLAWYALDLGAFLPYLSSFTGEDPQGLREQVAHLLMQACAAGRYSKHLPDEPWTIVGPKRIGSSSMTVSSPAAEMSADQAGALTRLLDLLAPLFALYQSNGEERGRSILHQLLDGKLSTDELDDRTERRLAERAKLIEKLAGT